MKVSLKILNLGIILKTFTNGINDLRYTGTVSETVKGHLVPLQ